MSELGKTNVKKCPVVAKYVKIFKNGVRKSSRNTVVAQPKKFLFTFLKSAKKTASGTLQNRGKIKIFEILNRSDAHIVLNILQLKVFVCGK